jgi:hypothetical protein
MSPLHTIYQHLLERARATGTDYGETLRKGARLAVRVRDGQVTLTLSRKDKPVGDEEIATFRAHCQVPATATRIPAEGQRTREVKGEIWHYLAYVWPEEVLEEA